MAVVTMRELLEAGIHFGHQTRRWHPKMSRYIYGERNGIYIIDLQKTMRQTLRAYNLVRDTVANGGHVLFVGTKKQAQEVVKREAERCGMYYVNSRWLGGTLTNWQTIKSSISKYQRLRDLEEQGKLGQYGKKEASMLLKQNVKLQKNLDGIKNMPGVPQIMFVVDAKKEYIAVREADRLGIASIGVVDTNCDPDVVSLPIPGNDDAIRSVNLFCKLIADAVLDGRMQGEKTGRKGRTARVEEEAVEAAMVEEAEAADVETADVEAADEAAEQAAVTDQSEEE
ncbi:MAG: 30S ribosomal protein S2 [Candidatus Hydrogenedentes bacterium]|nr:30S ribosomal protein S2 [Candidatus Hydrogenedentota bacterium]